MNRVTPSFCRPMLSYLVVYLAAISPSRIAAAAPCTTPPSFAGASTAVNAGTPTCGITLGWTPATPACGGTLTYTAYRGTNGSFVPSLTNRIASRLTTTSFTDVANLKSGQTYWYIVRATEAADSTVEESNLSHVSAAPTSLVTSKFLDDFDGNRPANAAAYWSASAPSLNISTCLASSPTHAYWFGAPSGACIEYYQPNNNALLVLGGDGTTPGINGFDFPAVLTSATFSFYQGGFLESGYDFANVYYGTTGPAGPWTLLISGTGLLAPAAFDLSMLAGKTVWFSWQYTTDSVVEFLGASLDDVQLSITTTLACVPGTAAAGSPHHLRFLAQPVDTVAGGTVTPAVTVALYDEIDNLVATDVDVQLALGSNTNGASLLGTLHQTTNGGIATFADLVVDEPGLGYSLYALVDGLPAAKSEPFDATVGAPTRLAFIAQPPPRIVAGQPFSVQVALQDAFGNIDPASAEVSVTLSAGSMTGATTVNMVDGVALFSGLSVAQVASGLTLQATGAGFNVTSAPFVVVNASASLLTVVLEGTAQQGALMSAHVTAFDALGNIAKDERNVVMTSSDAKAQLPAPFALHDGRGTRAVVFGSSGAQSISVADALDASITGTASLMIAPVDAPTVALLNPRDGEVVSGTVNIIAAATVGLGSAVDHVTVFVDGEPVGSSAHTVVSALWDTSAASDAHVITAEVTDQAGNKATATAVRVSVLASTDAMGGEPGGDGCAAVGNTNLALVLVALAWMRRDRRHRKQ